jgi:urea transport system substrate-binding protein
VWQTKGPIVAEAWSPHIAENKGKVANWQYPWVCGNCTKPKF